jgi:hypothetical protein
MLLGEKHSGAPGKAGSPALGPAPTALLSGIGRGLGTGGGLDTKPKGIGVGLMPPIKQVQLLAVFN